MSSILRSSKFVRYFVGAARNIVTYNSRDVDRSLLQKSQNITGVLTSNFSSSSSCYQAGSNLDITIRRIDEDARKMGRISLKEVEEALNEIRYFKKATTSQSLMVIRCCGNLVPEETPEHRTQLVEEIWNTLEKLRVPLDISHYNALLKVYLENEHKFSPTEFLAKLEKQGVEPNRVTYQRLIAGYCQMGDIAGATKILEFMKEKQLPVSEGVFNALILGHSQADDMESAEGMLGVMKQANLEPSNETYSTLMCGYAHRGDQDALDRLIQECKLKDVLLTDKDILEVTYSAAVRGHDDLVDKLLQNIRHMLAYNQDAANMMLRLITKGQVEASYKVFQTMQAPVRSENMNMSGHILIKQLVKTNSSVEQILKISERLEKDGHTSYGMHIAVETSFYHGNVDLTLNLLRILKKQNKPIRVHYFWPSLLTKGKAGDTGGLIAILKTMVEEFGVLPNVDTLKDYYLPFCKLESPKETLDLLLSTGTTRRQAVVAIFLQLITQNKLTDAISFALMHSGVNLRTVNINRMLCDALSQTGDVKSVIALVHIVIASIQNSGQPEWIEEEDDFSDLPGKFLFSVISYVPSRERVVDVLREMVSNGLAISSSSAELLESRMQDKYLTPEVSDLLAQLSSGELKPVPIKKGVESPSRVMNAATLERIKEKIIANNGPQDKYSKILRSLFQVYCYNRDLENALKIKQEWEQELKQELPQGCWALLLDVYAEKGDLSEIKQCLDHIKGFNTEMELDSVRIARTAKAFIQNNELDEAISLIKNTKPRGEMSFLTKNACWQALQATAEITKDPEQVKKLLDTMVAEKYIEINNVALGPIIKACILRDDLMLALKEFERCVQLFRATPWKNEIALKLIEKEDPVNLQKLVDLSTQVHGEINSLYDLVLSFVECGRVRQARKILETPGLRSRNLRIQSACERYKKEGLATPLEGLVEATKDLPFFDRSEIYYNLLETYCQNNNVEKALALWTQMQDEDVNVSDEFLIKLGGFLESKGLQVPFQIPKHLPDRHQQELQERKSEGSGEVQKRKDEMKMIPKTPLSLALNNRDIDKALQIKTLIDNEGGSLKQTEMNGLIELLVDSNRLPDAVNLVVSVPEDQLPSLSVLKFLINKLCTTGKLDQMKQLGAYFSEEYLKKTSYINNYFNCAVVAGKVEEELEKLESEIDNAKTPEEVDYLSLKFPRGGIYSVLESSPNHTETVTRIVEKFHSKGVKGPANCLCMFYLTERQYDKAREIYQQYNLHNSSRIMFRNVIKKARVALDEKMLEELISLLKGSPSITPQVEGLIYSNLINIYLNHGNVEVASAKLDEALSSSVPLECIYFRTLTNLKEKMQAKNLPFKYTIPSKREQSELSSTSSSSDVEPQQTVAAKH